MAAKMQIKKDGQPGAADFRWDDIRVLLAVMRAGSLKGAGERLGVNASTVGRRLETLEAAWGLHLFDRTSDGVLPTAALERLLPAATGLEHAAETLAANVHGFEREPEGRVRITAPPGVAQFLVAPELPRLLRKWPRLQIEIDASIGYADMNRREADLALRAVRPSRGDLVAQRLATAGSDVLASPRLVRRLGGEPLGDAAEIDWIDWGPELAHLHGARWLAQQVEPEAIVLRTNDISTQVMAARAGLGALVASRVMAKTAGLVMVDLAPALRRSLDAVPRDELWLVGHRAMRQVPRIRVVWEFFTQLAARLPLSDPP